MSTTLLLRARRARHGAPAVTRAVAIDSSVNEARWLLWPAFGLWIAFLTAGILFR